MPVAGGGAGAAGGVREPLMDDEDDPDMPRLLAVFLIGYLLGLATIALVSVPAP